MKELIDITNEGSMQKGFEKMIREKVSNAHYYEGDPREGGIRVPRNQSTAFIELVKAMESATGLPYIPTDDAEQMKIVREELYDKQSKELIERRKWNSDIETSNEELKTFRRLWLNDEKDNIQRWKAEVPKHRPEIIIELTKYETFIDELIKEAEIRDTIGTFSHCTSKEFKSDISDLCPECPLPAQILKKIEEQIVFQAQQQKDILTRDQFAEYCNNEVRNAQKAMMETHLYTKQDKDDSKFRPSRILVFIWNKERIKALNRLQFNDELASKHTTSSSELNVDTAKEIGRKAETYTDFAGLFTAPNDIAGCVDALRRIDKPVINQAGHWIGRRGSKSILVAWIDRLEQCNKIITVTNRRLLVSLLNAYFPGLNFGADARQFGERNRVYDQYASEFAALILP